MAPERANHDITQSRRGLPVSATDRPSILDFPTHIQAATPDTSGNLVRLVMQPTPKVMVQSSGQRTDSKRPKKAKMERLLPADPKLERQKASSKSSNKRKAVDDGDERVAKTLRIKVPEVERSLPRPTPPPNANFVPKIPEMQAAAAKRAEDKKKAQLAKLNSLSEENRALKMRISSMSKESEEQEAEIAELKGQLKELECEMEERVIRVDEDHEAENTELHEKIAKTQQ